MLRDITIGQHFPGNSVLHRCDPRLKLVATIAYIVVLFVAPNPLGLALSIETVYVLDLLIHAARQASAENVCLHPQSVTFSLQQECHVILIEFMLSW